MHPSVITYVITINEYIISPTKTCENMLYAINVFLNIRLFVYVKLVVHQIIGIPLSRWYRCCQDNNEDTKGFIRNRKSKDKQDNSIKKKNKMVQRPSNNLDFFNIQNKIILLELKNKSYKIMTRCQLLDLESSFPN